MTNTEYVEHFKALVCVVETYGGAYGQEPGLVATELVAQGDFGISPLKNGRKGVIPPELTHVQRLRLVGPSVRVLGKPSR